jgi:hypothetical protein
MINATLQQHFILTWHGFVCVGEAAAPVIAVVEPLPSTNNVNSFASADVRVMAVVIAALS